MRVTGVRSSSVFVKFCLRLARIIRAAEAVAQRNRDRLLAAARELFAERGVDVAMADIARHAGVSNGTLYNRFPTREDLIEAVFTDRLETMAALAGQSLADDDPWRGFVAYLTAVCELQAADRGFNEVAARGMPPSPAAQRLHEAGQAAIAGLLQRAKPRAPWR